MLLHRSRIYLRQDPTGGGGTGQGAAAAGDVRAGGGSGPIIPIDQSAAAQRLSQLETENRQLKDKNTQLEVQFKDGAKKLEELHATIVSPEYLQFVATKGKGGTGDRRGSGDGQDREPHVPSADELNSMDNAQLVLHITSAVENTVKKIVGPVANRTEHVEAQTQVRAAAERFPDFWEYQNAMVQIAERNPTMDPTTVYLTVKGLEAATGKSYKNPSRGDGQGNAPAAGGSSRPTERRPVSSEIGSGPSNALGGNREVEPQSYAEAAGSIYDQIFGRG